MRGFQKLPEYFRFLYSYFHLRASLWFSRFEAQKDVLVEAITDKRGRWARPFLHGGVAGLAFLGFTIGPSLVHQVTGKSPNSTVSETGGTGGSILGAFASADFENVATEISDKPRSEIFLYTIQTGDTVSKIADKFDISQDSIYWENEINEKTKLKPGDKLRVLPVTGVKHTVSRGETIESIAKKYGVDAQNIVNWPFNTFVDDEKFTIAVGQALVIPDGVKPDEPQISPRRYLARQTPDAGAVTASGIWVWPTQGRLTQYFAWYHPAVDIANKERPAVVAADSGMVIAVNSGRYSYGNHVILDHGNGYTTLYAHLSSFSVSAGQTVAKGAVLGIMGSTGRSTGPHLHFEIRLNGIAQNPLGYLK